jgi:hypothetical protein
MQDEPERESHAFTFILINKIITVGKKFYFFTGYAHNTL